MVMRGMWFEDRWIRRIKSCIESVEYYIPVAGGEVGPITPQRGLRQGNPLSPYLFIFVAEGLSGLIRRQEAVGNIVGVVVARQAPEVSHLFFADDSYLFFRTQNRECKAVKGLLQEYELSLGQQVNYSKSSIMFSPNVSEETGDSICNQLGVLREGASSRYLGLPSLIGRSDQIFYLPNSEILQIKHKRLPSNRDKLWK
ncbi:unnamed protein product [Cuscuta europaea]|uniref:Reverse transcriptase domain-containing protein n=1 Tax=Cuscuta europaea TaxID=41803 RepID=A0A9P1EA07_CUSEU|nr:unnamed protein product [Cuscuta europaea]